MELWIRSQDKTILEKANQLIIRENNNEYGGIDYVIQGCYTLAHYKTKERALEILNEIQNILFPKDMIDELEALYTNLIIRNKNCDSYVYEMPEE